MSVSRGTISSLDLGTPAGQDRRRAAATRRACLMRIRRKDREAPESPHAAGPAPYDYDRDAPGAGGTGPTSLDPVKSLIAEPTTRRSGRGRCPRAAEVPAVAESAGGGTDGRPEPEPPAPHRSLRRHPRWPRRRHRYEESREQPRARQRRRSRRPRRRCRRQTAETPEPAAQVPPKRAVEAHRPPSGRTPQSC